MADVIESVAEEAWDGETPLCAWTSAFRAGAEWAWKAGHGWCDDGIDGFCFHEPFTLSPYLEDTDE